MALLILPTLRIDTGGCSVNLDSCVITLIN